MTIMLKVMRNSQLQGKLCNFLLEAVVSLKSSVRLGSIACFQQILLNA